MFLFNIIIYIIILRITNLLVERHINEQFSADRVKLWCLCMAFLTEIQSFNGKTERN
jgi:hypothetical protein